MLEAGYEVSFDGAVASKEKYKYSYGRKINMKDDKLIEVTPSPDAPIFSIKVTEDTKQVSGWVDDPVKPALDCLFFDKVSIEDDEIGNAICQHRLQIEIVNKDGQALQPIWGGPNNKIVSSQYHLAEDTEKCELCERNVLKNFCKEVTNIIDYLSWDKR